MAQDTLILAEQAKLFNASGNALQASGTVTVTGPFAVSGTASVTGPFNVSGTTSLTGSTQVSGTLNVSGQTNISGSVSLPSGVSGGLLYDFVSGTVNAGLNTTASSQSMSVSGSLITMTSGLSAGIGPHTIYVSANSTSATCSLTPTSSASTSGIFQNGVEITVINLGVSGSRIVIPVSGAGSYNTDTIVISAGHCVRFIYNAPLQTWIPID